MSAFSAPAPKAPEEAADVPVTGGPEQVAERLHAYAEAGAGMVGLSLDPEGP
ncbi:hypothetical protein [Nonomuraea sp. GTA35]|uniref:hypothetical protein n=1 Tax=Nonomuraea sp. GTA35 TaxID=1676746 RepID=UPI0035BFE993